MKEAQKRYYVKNREKLLEKQRVYDKNYYKTHKEDFHIYYVNRSLLKKEQSKLTCVMNC